MSIAPLLGFRWSIKRSFLDYISRAPGGQAALSEGAIATENREVIFGPDPREIPCPIEPSRSLAFVGTVTFTAHSGMLRVPISNPGVAFRANGGDITILDPFDRHGTARLRLASFDIEDHLVADGFEHWLASDVRLAEEGCELFNNIYRASEPLEPLTIIVPAAPRPD